MAPVGAHKFLHLVLLPCLCQRVVALSVGRATISLRFDTSHSHYGPRSTNTDALQAKLPLGAKLTAILDGSNLTAATAWKPKKKPWGGHSYLFFAGLEGTGHHFMSTVFEPCRRSGLCQSPSAGFSKAIWEKRFSQPSLVTAFRQQDVILGAKAPHGKRRRLLIMNTITPRLPGYASAMLSYPNGGRSKYPRIPFYLKAAKNVGDNMKVVVLLRNSMDIVESNLRRWGHTEMDAVRAAGVLFQQLQSIGTGNFRCLNYDALPGLAVAVDQAALQTGWHGGFSAEQAIIREFEAWHGCTKKGNCLGPSPRLDAAQLPIWSLCGRTQAALSFSNMSMHASMLAKDAQSVMHWLLQDD